jgi:hypothetical protein
MTTTLTDTWKALRSTPAPTTGAYRLQQVHAARDVRVFAAVQVEDGAPGLLLDVPQTALLHDRRDLLCRTFSLTMAAFSGMPAGRVGMLTVLKEPEYEDLFAVLTGDILSAVTEAAAPHQAVNAAIRVIERWRYFMERRRGSLSEERVRGLIGELVIVARLLAHHPPDEVLTAWTGPHDALHDFELPASSVEVKTFQSEDGPTVRISDPRQLDVVRARPVHLVAIQLARTNTHGRPLPAIVASVAELVASSPGGRDLFERKLAEYGYLPVHEPLYSEPYAVESVQGYTVTDDFPRIRSADVPPPVSDVQFSITLAALARFELDIASVVGPQSSALEVRLE